MNLLMIIFGILADKCNKEKLAEIMESAYLLDSIPVLNKNIALDYNREMDADKKINFLVQNLRYTINNQRNLNIITNPPKLDYTRFPFLKKEYDILSDNLNNEGNSVVDLLRKLNWDKGEIKFEKYNISNLSSLVDSDILKRRLSENKHSISLVSINDKRFIVDCAYRQFFSLTNNGNFNNINQTCVGLSMLRDEESKKVAEQILRYGYIEATPENLKTYMDGFILDSENGEQVKTPSQEEYTDKIIGEVQKTGGKLEKEYELSELWKLYSKKWFPDNSERVLSFGNKNSAVRNNLKNKLFLAKEKFQIITIGEQKYIRTKDGDVEFSLDNLKTYLDHVIIQAACDKSDIISPNLIKKIEEANKDFITPDVEEYLKLYPCAKISKVYSNFIIENSPYIEQDYSENYSEQMSDEEKLMSIVQKERRYLMQDFDLKKDNLGGECENSSARIILDCTSKGLNDATYLSPHKYVGGEGHNCAIANLNGKSYLIDCTYSQFFVKDPWIKDHCGIYMMSNEKRKEVANQILKYGWIEATPENIKAYMDGFTMAERKSFEETGITAEEYVEMLKDNENNPINVISNSPEQNNTMINEDSNNISADKISKLRMQMEWYFNAKSDLSVEEMHEQCNSLGLNFNKEIDRAKAISTFHTEMDKYDHLPQKEKSIKWNSMLEKANKLGLSMENELYFAHTRNELRVEIANSHSGNGTMTNAEISEECFALGLNYDFEIKQIRDTIENKGKSNNEKSTEDLKRDFKDDYYLYSQGLSDLSKDELNKKYEALGIRINITFRRKDMKKVALDVLARDVQGTQSKLKQDYLEIESPTQVIDKIDNNKSIDE